MDGVQPRAEHLVAFVEMVQVSATVMAASVAITTLLNRTQVALVDGIAQLQRAEAGEKVSIARVARWHDAIKHINATAHAFDNILRLTDAHQVTRLGHGQMRQGVLQRRIAHFQRLADRQTANGITGQVKRDQPLRRLAPQIGIDAALHDAKKMVRIARVRRL